MRHVLVTGGAGFIGSHLVDAMLERGDRVRVLDSLDPQVHGESKRPEYLNPQADLIVGDVRNPADVERALAGIDAVVHFAACVGVGQSMYEMARYTAVNTVGTAVLLEALARRPVERLLVASSMSIYGEGLYRTPDGRAVIATRRADDVRSGKWDPVADDGSPLTPVPTPEDKTAALESVYALSKYDQERLCLVAGNAYRMPTVALRFFNVYGPRQALSNPYTGVLAIFSSRLLNGRAPLIFEDGRQQRDFVSVTDVARACLLALDIPEAAGQVFNIGSGHPVDILQVAERIARVLGTSVPPEVTGHFRVGDVRHCFADISRARQVLGYEPSVAFNDGLVQLAAWLEGQTPDNRVQEARAELAARGLAL
jgi:dTDP-L-rhamnose 4-epimerase